MSRTRLKNLDARARCVILVTMVTVGITMVTAEDYKYQADCRSPLGMQSGNITDDQIRASSSYDEASVGPQNARIRTERNGGAWCPFNPITSASQEWLEVDLLELKVVSLVETQGRFGNGQGQEYAQAYTLEYQRLDTSRWVPFRNRTGGRIFQGNVNTYTTVLREINPVIIARKIRISPTSRNKRTICMRVELYGCNWTAGVVSYSVPQGERRGSEVDLYDTIYDGEVDGDLLTGGLGQLTDRDKGQTNFRLDPMGIGKRGYQWIGWKNDTEDRPPIEIVFEFDQVRNFSTALFYSNNMFSKDVRVFRMAKLYFSVGGVYYQQEPVYYQYMRDIVMEYARNVIIPIPHRIARFIKVQLFFDARWMMLSEAEFVSVVVKGNYTEEGPPADTEQDALDKSKSKDESASQSRTTLSGPGAPPKEAGGGSQQTAEGGDQVQVGIIVGVLGAVLLLVAAVIVLVVVRRRRHKFGHGLKTAAGPQQHVTLNLDDLRALTTNGKVTTAANGNVYKSIATEELGPALGPTLMPEGDLYREPHDGIQGRRLPELPAYKMAAAAAANAAHGDSTGTDTLPSQHYAVPDQPAQGPPSYQESGPPHPQALYGAMDHVGLQGFSGNSLYAVPHSLELLWQDDLAVLEFPRANLLFVEKLGQGQFGEVDLCEALGIRDALGGDDFLLNRTGAGGAPTMLVAVKSLRPDAHQCARADFHKEVKIMCRLKDPNIVRVLGVTTQEEPLSMIVEYMKYGDLAQFLQQHVPAECTVSRNARALSYGCLIFMSTQIASGMKYLETLNMVHRDLATRNCLVGHNYMIKISDFGMSRDLYSRDYYRIEGKAVLPIRWMAWESLLLGKFSTKSDVWSFGCTFWEVLTFARDQPYSGLTDEQVIDNCGFYYRGDGRACHLPQPSNCPKEIFDLLAECWNREEYARPAFREIHMFLSRKNMGYDPRDEWHATPPPRGNGIPVV